MIKKLSFSYQLILIGFISVLLCIVLQEMNAAYLDLPSERYGMVYTADEPSYINPAQNYLTTGIWKDNFEGNSSYFQRPPGYGILYLLSKMIFGSQVLLGIRVLQLFLFFISIILLGNVMRILTKNQKLSVGIALIFGLTPIFSGYTAYVLTEAVTPFLIIWSIYSAVNESRLSNWQIVLSNSLLLLVRPQLALFSIVFYILFLIRKDKIKIIAISASFIPILIWTLRTFQIEKDWPKAHPIYSATNITLYRPGHESLTDLFRVWEHDGEKFHAVTGLLIRGENNIHEALLLVPEKYQKKVKPILTEFHDLVTRTDYGKSKQFHFAEKEFVQKTKHLRKELIKENPGDFYIITPMHSAQFLLSKSQLNQFIFQSTFRGNILMELLRLLAVLFIITGLAITTLHAFQFKNTLLSLISIASLVYLLYLFFFQRMNEDRYLVPLLPILLLNIGVAFQQLPSYLKRIRSKNT